MRRGTIIGAVVVAGALVAGAGVAAAADHSGTVLAVNRDQGTIVIGEVGPWEVKQGKTQITRRTFSVDPSAAFVSVRRSQGAGPSGFVGEFVLRPLDRWAVKEGDFVTVHVEQGKKGLTAATRITVAKERE